MLDNTIPVKIAHCLVFLPLDDKCYEMFGFNHIDDAFILLDDLQSNREDARATVQQANNVVTGLARQGWNAYVTSNAKFRIMVVSGGPLTFEQVDNLVATLQRKLGRDLIPTTSDDHD